MHLSPLVRGSARVAAGLLLAALVVAPATADDDANAAVMPIQSRPHGQTYGEWSGAFWQWATSLPVGENPLFDAPGADGTEGQAGKVWFLGGTFLSTEVAPGEYVGVADRAITVPAGTSLFIPIVNAEADTFVDADPNDPNLEAVLRAKANALADAIDTDSLYLKVDGEPVRNLDLYRAESPLTYVPPLPEDNLYGVAAGTDGYLVGDGYYATLKPLPVGTHTIEFGGLVDATDLLGITFELDVRYTVTVAPVR